MKLRIGEYHYHTETIQVYAGGKPESLQVFEHPHHSKEMVFILGDPILRKGEDFSYPELADWKVLLHDEPRLNQLDGHYLVLIAAADEIRAYNDPLCKRSMWIHESSRGFFFCSEISLLKDAGLAELDLHKFGAYWHTMFPPNLRKYAPSSRSYYSNVEMMFQGSSAVINPSGLKISDTSYQVPSEELDLSKMLYNMTLLPLRAGRKVCLGLSGGMDSRSLLAILLDSGMDFWAVHLGRNDTMDYRIAEAIARDYGLDFRCILEQDLKIQWDQVVNYMYTRGFGYNPATSCLMAYHPVIAEDADIFLGGCFGELYRLRFFAAHIASTFKLKTPDYRYFASYLYHKPVDFFIPEVNLQLHRSFMQDLSEVVADMPPSKGMPRQLWMDIFLIRYSIRSIHMPDLINLDHYLHDFMPFLQPSLIGQHWHYGFFAQLNEKLHRDIIRRCAPGLQKYPLAMVDTAAGYHYRPYALKLKAYLQSRTSIAPNRNQAFLNTFKTQILDLAQEHRISLDSWIDHSKLQNILDGYYGGRHEAQNAVLSFVAYALGK